MHCCLGLDCTQMGLDEGGEWGASHICKNTYSGSFLLPSSSFLLAPGS
jgi:hypothetical protein